MSLPANHEMVDKPNLIIQSKKQFCNELNLVTTDFVVLVIKEDATKASQPPLVSVQQILYKFPMVTSQLVQLPPRCTIVHRIDCVWGFSSQPTRSQHSAVTSATVIERRLDQTEY